MGSGNGFDRLEYGRGSAADTILDFRSGAGVIDVIALIGFGAAFDTFAEVLAATTNVRGDAVINFGGGDTLTLIGVTKAQLVADDFLFI